MTGTLVNCIAVVLGGVIGILLKKGIKENKLGGVYLFWGEEEYT